MFPKAKCRSSATAPASCALGSASSLKLSPISITPSYALDLLARSPFFSAVLPSLYATSPWVPNSRSPLHLIPPPLVSRAHVILPRLDAVLQGIGRCFATLASLFTTPPAAEPWPVPDRLRPVPKSEAEKYRPLPPYHADHTLSPPKYMWKAIEKAMLAEPMQGMSQEFSLCLSRVYDAEWYEMTLRAVAERSAQQGRKVDVEVFWALGDGMINKKAQGVYSRLFAARSDVYFSCAKPGSTHSSAHIQRHSRMMQYPSRERRMTDPRYLWRRWVLCSSR